MPYIHFMGDIVEDSVVRSAPTYTAITKDEAETLKALYETYDAKLRDLRNKHSDQEIHIFGTGESLNQHAAKVDWSSQITIGVNGAPRSIPNLTYWLMCDDFYQGDKSLYVWVREWLANGNLPTTLIRRGIIKHLNSGWLPDVMFRHSPHGPVNDPALGLYWGNSSVQAAIDLARHMGAESIHLWGVDYVGAHSYDLKDEFKSADFNRIQEQFKRVGAGLKIFNHNPDSRLTCFPIAPPVILPAICQEPVIPAVIQPNRINNTITIDSAAQTVEFFVNDTLFVRGLQELSKEQNKAIKTLKLALSGFAREASNAKIQ